MSQTAVVTRCSCEANTVSHTVEICLTPSGGTNTAKGKQLSLQLLLVTEGT